MRVSGKGSHPFARRQNHDEDQRDHGDQFSDSGGQSVGQRRGVDAAAVQEPGVAQSPFPGVDIPRPCRHRDARTILASRTTESFIRPMIPPAGTSR